MILRGLLIAAGGFLFIFSPGLPMSLLVRRSPSFNRDIVYWGIGAWPVALLPSLFLQSLLRQILQNSQTPRGLSGQPMDYALTLAGALLTAFFVAGGMYLVLRFKRIEATTLPPNGLALGFGVGLIAQVFTGLSLVGAGFRLMFGDASTETLVSLAQVSYLNLLLALLALILFRPALLAVSAARGVLVARALNEHPLFFGLAVLVDAVFVWAILALQLALGGESPGQVLVGDSSALTSVMNIVYYVLAFGLAYRWLLTQIAGWESEKVKGKGKRDAGN
ncbi:MAG: hypothetical protein HW378_2972 [Anaerolineales bacterium]|nr:hypothetical protein [Anaerolineales bacterium]